MSAQSSAERNGRSTVRQPTARITSSAITTICSIRCCGPSSRTLPARNTTLGVQPCALHDLAPDGLAPLARISKQAQALRVQDGRCSLAQRSKPTRGPPQAAQCSRDRPAYEVEGDRDERGVCCGGCLSRGHCRSARPGARAVCAAPMALPKGFAEGLCRRSRRPAVEDAAKSGLARRILRYCARSGGSGRPRPLAIARRSQPGRQAYPAVGVVALRPSLRVPTEGDRICIAISPG